MSDAPNDRLDAIRAVAEELVTAADGGLGIGGEGLSREEAEAAQQEMENALQECYDLGVRIRDLAAGS